MKSIFIVTRGEYSDYSIVSVFDERPKAEEFISHFSLKDHSGFNDIEEYELNSDAVQLSRNGYAPWRVLMLKNGDTEEAQEQNENIFNVIDATYARTWIWRRSKAPAYKGKGVPDCLNVTCWAKDRKHAIKIANEKRLQMLSTNEWK